VPQLRLGNIALNQEAYAHNTSKFDLTLFLSETADGLQGAVEYSPEIYSDQTIGRMMAHYLQLLQSIAVRPEEKVGLLPMLTLTEKQMLLVDFNTSLVNYPVEKTIVEFFEEQVLIAPHAIALVFEDKQLSYLELNKQANQLAHYLRSKGIKEDELVPICVERSIYMMVGLLGILKAGAAYVPIESDFPENRIRYIIEDTGATVVVSSLQNSSKLNDFPFIDIVKMDEEGSMWHFQPTDNLQIQIQVNHLAYVIYTSGSTGNPKGVMVEHRSLVDYVSGLKQSIQIDDCRSFALVSTIATDLGNTVIYSSLLTGGTLHLFSKDTVSNIEVLHRYFETHPIDCLKIVPSHWVALSMQQNLLLPHKLLIFGGETLPATLPELIKRSGSGCRIINHYGPTETTIGKLLHVVKNDRIYNNAIPIGRPFSNTRIYVLSKELQLCPVGVTGQLFIAGEGVARGYLNNRALTDTKFIKVSFDRKDGSRMYATGDLVKYLPDGNIEFIGRVDDQVKIRGYRIEPGEIEQILQQCPLVRQGVVVTREDKQGDKRLVGYIVPHEWFDREEILSFLRERLPEYMVPALLVELENLPFTANGKVDKKALPDPGNAEQPVYSMNHPVMKWKQNWRRFGRMCWK
jgi:amino acid adenylation domain-containing protein